MSSILKVDQLKDSGGNAIITSDGSGNLTAGTIPSTVIGTGALLQVVSSSNAGNSTNTTSISYVDTVNTLNITPLSSNSKIVVIADHAISIDANSQQRADIRIRETVTSTTITDKRYIGQDGAGGTQSNRSIALCGVLTNSSTAQKTFKVQVRKADGQSSEAGNIGLNWYNNATHSMIALEIAG